VLGVDLGHESQVLEQLGHALAGDAGDLED